MVLQCKLLVVLTLLLIANRVYSQGNNLEQTIKLKKQAKEYTARGRYDSSKNIVQKIVRIEMLDRNWKGYSEALNDLAIIFSHLNKHDSAVHYFDSSILISTRYLPGDTLLLGTLYNNIGGAYIDAERFLEAMENINLSEALLVKRFGEHHTSLVETYNNKGLTYSKLQDPLNQMKYYKMALDVMVQNPDSPIAAYLDLMYNNVAIAYDKIGDYESELIYLNKSITTTLKKQLIDSLSLATTYNNFSLCYRNLGDLDKSLLYAIRALEIRRRHFPANHPKIAEALNNTAYAYGNENPDLGLTLLDSALVISKTWKEGTNRELIGVINQNFGYLFGLKNRYDKQRIFWQRVIDIHLELYKANNAAIAEDYYNLGTTYQHLKEFDTAIIYHDKSLSIQKGMLPPKHSKLALSYKALARCYEMLGQYSKSLKYIQSALAALVEDFNSTDITTNPNLDHVYSRIYLLDALKLKAQILLQFYNDSSQNVNDLIIALNTTDLGRKLLDSVRFRYSSPYSKTVLGRDYSDIFTNGIGIAYELYYRSKDKKYLYKALEYSEKNKAIVLWESMRELKLQRLAQVPDSILTKEKMLAVKIDFYQRYLNNNIKNNPSRESYLAQYLSTKSDYEDLINRIKERYAHYYSTRYEDSSFGVTNMQALLSPNLCILEYAHTDSVLYIFAISKTDLEVYRISQRSNIDSLLLKYIYHLNKGVITTQDIRQVVILSNRIYRLLLQPATRSWGGKERVIIIPDGIIGYIPFETLITGPITGNISFEKAKYFIHDADISYHYSTKLLFENNKHNQSSNSFIGFAPVFTNTKRNGYVEQDSLTAIERSISDTSLRKLVIQGNVVTPLPYTREEVSSIMQMFITAKQKSAGYFFDEAKESTFKNAISNYRYIHVATHGIVNDKNPQFTGLLFIPTTAGRDTEIDLAHAPSEEDGFLSAGEIYDLDIDSADLVVLSACETGIGKLVRGEGIMSMVRGFLYSGAPNVIFSLWRVPDNSTKDLMIELYRGILMGKSYSTALRNAKLKLLRNRLTSNPKNWGGFVLIGNI